MPSVIDVRERFMAKVLLSNGCWQWTASANAQGYGRIRVSGNVVAAHRLSFQMNVGVIPHGMLVLHRCDNPSCVRPDHLFLGTQRDNVHDMIAKGRRGAVRDKAALSRKLMESAPRGDAHYSKTNPEKVLRGDLHHGTRVSDAQVRELRRLYATGSYSKRSLAKMFSVSFSHTWRLLTNARVEGSVRMPSNRSRGETHYAAKLSDDRIDELRARIASGATNVAVAKEFGVSRSLVSMIKTGKSRARRALR